MTQHSDLVTLLGGRIRALRKQKKLTILTLATICSISEKHLGQIERGKSNASLDLIEKITNALGISTYDLFVQYNHSTKNDNVAMHDNLNDKEIIKELYSIIENVDGELLQRIHRVVKACQD